MRGEGVEIRPAVLTSNEEKEFRDRKLRKACQDFESVFTYQLLRSMRRTIEKCDLFHGGTGEEVYETLLDQELAKSMAGNEDRGLAELLYQQLRRRDGAEAGGESVSIGTLRPPEPPQWPVRGRVSSEFGWRVDPISGEKRFHHGLDLAAGEGTEIHASMPGRVILSDVREGYGNVVVVDHGRGLTTLYAHNRENMVHEGDWVHSGDPLARVGSTGRSTGPHLHFEVRRHGRHLDPAGFLEGASGSGPV